MTALHEFVAANQPAPVIKHPSGWEPSVTWNGTEGVLCTGPQDTEPDRAIWDNLIADWGLNPDVTEVVNGSVQVRAWDANIGNGEVRRFKYYRATIRTRQAADDRADIEDLIKEVTRKKPLKTTAVDTEFAGALVALLSDWQIGKSEGGGSETTVERIKGSVLNLLAHIRYLKSVGRMPSALYLIGLGDMVEGCDGHYAMQTFQTDLDRRSQKRIVRRVLLWMVDQLLPLNIPIVLGAVPGNHGENRRDGKAFTTFTDNDDLACFEEVAEILAVNPERYGNVHIPSGAVAIDGHDLTMTLDVAGVSCGFAHGHQMRGGGAGAQAKVEKWWAGQALGRQRVASAQLLFTGHLHHFVVSEATGRTWFQAPAQDGGSAWWTSTSGQHSSAGMLTVGVGTGYGPRGWGDLQIL